MLEGLQFFSLKKTRENDGLPIEFNQTFWNSVGELLVESFNGAVITLIEKKDQDCYDLKNWRPISLLNVQLMHK